MFGRGVNSVQYGWALEKAGHHVDFYVRPARISQFPSEMDLDIWDLRQKKRTDRHVRTTYRTRLRSDLPADHDYDLIFVCINHHQIESAVEALTNRVGHATVLIFTNFWTDPLTVVAPLPLDQLAWGYPFAGGGIDTDHVLRGAIFPKVALGTFGERPTTRQQAVTQMFRDAGWGVSSTRRFREWLWVHFATHAAMSAQVIRAGSVRAVTTDPVQARQMIYNVREAAKVLKARGVTLTRHPELAPFYLPARLGAALIAFEARRNPGMKAMMDGHQRPEEIMQVFYDFMDETFGVALPRMEALKAEGQAALDSGSRPNT
nr:2-dehydropantoate 2-reductase N-terminal domain-containing protein [Sphingobium subterraneum]